MSHHSLTPLFEDVTPNDDPWESAHISNIRLCICKCFLNIKNRTIGKQRASGKRGKKAIRRVEGRHGRPPKAKHRFMRAGTVAQPGRLQQIENFDDGCAPAEEESARSAAECPTLLCIGSSGDPKIIDPKLGCRQSLANASHPQKTK
uniref:Uncharacterized protein n=1 Tax=Steinernema glaseri TaxID=37863 RepID=A0A1I8A0I7_9BILA